MRRATLPAALILAVSLIGSGSALTPLSGTQDRPSLSTMKQPDPGSGAAGTISPPYQVQAPLVETFKLTPDTGNWKHPAVAEDSKGNRLVIFRNTSGDQYFYVYCPKGGAWSSPSPIAGGNQPSLVRSMYAYMGVDSEDRFHCEWEDANGAVYASFKDGVWTTPVKPSLGGWYDFTSGMAVRPNGDVVTADCEGLGSNKEIFLHIKKKGESGFQSPVNITRDSGESSTQPAVAADWNNHSWVVWKSDYNVAPGGENLVIFLAQFDENNGGVDDWMVVSHDPGWAFLPQVAVNSENKVMAEWAQHTSGQQMSRLYNPMTKTLGPIVSLDIGLCRNPWHTFFSRLVARGEDFYAAVLNPGRIVYLLKFDESASAWTQVAQVSDRAAEIMSLYSGTDRMLIAWSSYDEPTNVYLTTVEVGAVVDDKYSLTIQSSTGGTTSPAPGTYRFDKGSQVSVRAIPNSGLRFSSWTGDVSDTDATITVTLDANKTIKANFTTVPAKTLTVQTTAGGTTNPVPGTSQRDQGSSVTITAVAETGYRFGSWSGDASGTASSVTVVMDTDKTVKANFIRTPLLTLSAGTGGTTIPPPGTQRFDLGTSVGLGTIPAAGYRFGSWSGDASGTALSISIIMDGDKTITANFVPLQTLTIQSGAGGTTNPVPGSYPYDRGGSVTVRAVPDEGYRFSGWSGDASSTVTPFIFTLDRDMTIKANFAFIPVPKPPLGPAVSSALDAAQTSKINTIVWLGNAANAGMELKEHWIYRKLAHQSDSELVKIGSVAAAVFQYADRGLPLNQKFAYALTTIPLDPFGKESDRSDVVGETSAFPPLSAACRTVVNSSLFRSEKINSLSWRPNPLNDAVTIAQYNIYRKRSDQDDSAYKLIGSVAGGILEYEDRRLSFDETYVYVIRSVDSGGFESGSSLPARE